MKSKKFFCDRCKQEIMSKPMYRYPHVWKDPKAMGSCDNAIFSKMLIFCPKCVEKFDKFNEKLKAELMFTDNDKLIEFYEQYGKK